MSRFGLVVLFIAAAIVAGCGGSGNSSPVPPASSPSSGPSSSPTSVPVGPTPSTVTITGVGYTLQFELPALTSGSSSTFTAQLVAAPPSGVPVPSSVKRRMAASATAAASKKNPLSVGTVTTLVYLTVSSSASVTFGSIPSFNFTLPTGTTIPSGATAYVALYDPSQSANGWVGVLGPGSVNGQSVSFTGLPNSFSFTAGVQYVFALVTTQSTVATPTPGPSAAPTALPAYCSNYTFPTSGVTINVTDDSGTGAVLVLYISNGTNFLDNTGNFTATSPNPIPAACFSSTTGSSATGKPLVIPTGLAAGRIYLAYATPNPSNTSAPPNPFSGANISGPAETFAAGPYPWDKIEYGTQSGSVIDTTQVDAVGLPVELSVTGGALAHQVPGTCATPASTTVGVSSCGYASVFSAVAQNSAYSGLLITQPFAGNVIDMRIVSPKNSFNSSSFQWNLFGDTADLPSPAPTFCPSSPSQGYLSCVLQAYDTTPATPRLFTSSVNGVAGTSGDYFCVTSDGSANFIFTDVGAATSCASATPNPGSQVSANPFKMPVQELTYGTPPTVDTGGASQCTAVLLFSQPWGNANVGSGHVFEYADAFAMWKALTAELNYGTMLTTSTTHPVGQSTRSLSSLFQDPMSNTYDQILHQYYDHNLAYGIAYDDLFGLDSQVVFATGDSINIRINEIPAATSQTGANPTPVATPSVCPSLPPNVGSF
jgi:hypothetical protein